MYTDCVFEVKSYAVTALPTPSGDGMIMPSLISLTTRDGAGRPALELEGHPHGDWTYGLVGGHGRRQLSEGLMHPSKQRSGSIVVGGLAAAACLLGIRGALEVHDVDA